MSLRAVNQLRENVRSLMRARGVEQKDLAFAMRRHPTWINKILKGTRPINIVDLDGLADFFGLATYQLFQPGISALTERRSGHERRSGRERRIGHTQRAMEAVATEIARVRQEPPATSSTESQVLARFRASDPQLREIVLRMLQLSVDDRKRASGSRKAAP